MKRALFLLLLPMMLSAEEIWDFWDISSDQIDYQLQTVCLQGHVNLASADELELKCDRAVLDRQSGHGRLESDHPTSYVKIRGCYKEEEGKKIYLTMRSCTVEVWMEDLTYVRQMDACGDAHFSYGDEWTARGSRAVFRHQGDETAFLAGTIELEADGGCVVEHLGGSRIVAEQMVLDLPNQKLLLKQPRGTIRGDQSQGAHLDLTFQADTASWDHRSQILTLTGAVYLNHDRHHGLTSNDEIRVACRSVGGKIVVQQIDCVGPTELVLADTGQRIRCQGKGFVDMGQQKLILTSPKNAEGEVDAENQLVFEGPQGEMKSDQLTLSFVLKDGEILPTLALAEGHISLKRLAASLASQYAICDELQYVPSDGEVLLKAKAPHRVVFLDQQYDLKVSAPAVKMTRNAKTGKETLKGLGDVRMTLLDRELARLRQRFDIVEEQDESNP